MKLDDIDWKISQEDEALIRKIVNRVAEHAFDKFDVVSAMMDVYVVHRYICPLDLKRMADGKDADIIHDVYGIMKNLNRNSIKLKNYFIPRFELRDKDSEDSDATTSPSVELLHTYLQIPDLTQFSTQEIDKILVLADTIAQTMMFELKKRHSSELIEENKS